MTYKTARTFAASVLIPFSLFALPAAAQDASDDAESVSFDRGTGLAFGLRAAYGIPLGESIKGEDLSDSFKGTIAPQVEVGYFFNRNLSLGAFFQYGVALVNKEQLICNTADTDCSGSVMRFGLDLNYHFSPERTLSPWVGVGAGYEIAQLKLREDDIEGTASISGFEFAHVQGGVDFQVSRSIWVGPYVTGTVGQYDSRKVSVGDTSISTDLEDKALHFWLQPGLRVQVRL